MDTTLSAKDPDGMPFGWAALHEELGSLPGANEAMPPRQIPEQLVTACALAHDTSRAVTGYSDSTVAACMALAAWLNSNGYPDATVTRVVAYAHTPDGILRYVLGQENYLHAAVTCGRWLLDPVADLTGRITGPVVLAIPPGWGPAFPARTTSGGMILRYYGPGSQPIPPDPAWPAIYDAMCEVNQ